MTYEEESYILDSIKQVKAEVHDCKVMLSQLCSVVNTWMANHHRENEDDFGRNVMANILSEVMMKGKR